MSNDSVAPVFLLSSERSGTNLLRRRLNEWQSTLFCPAPIHLLKNMDALVPYYGDLRHDDNFLNMIDDALSLCYHHFSPWELGLSRDEILESYLQKYGEYRSIVLLMDILYRKYAEFKGFQSYFCKDNNLFNYVLRILRDIPDARFIYLCRDPRDYVLSQLKLIVRDTSITRHARNWAHEQRKCARYAFDSTFESPVYCVNYERLISEEHKVIDEMCSFFGLNRNEAPADAANVDTGIPFDWRNISKPTMTNNFGKYKKAFSLRVIKVIEAITWSEMNLLGYKPEFAQRPKLSLFYAYIEPVLGYARNKVELRFRSQEIPQGRKDMIRTVRALRSKF